jgi:hypothetical protein
MPTLWFIGKRLVNLLITHIFDGRANQRGSGRNLVSTLERDLSWDRAIFNLKVLDEAEAGSAGTQPRRGIIRWAHRHDEKRGRAAAASRPRRASAHRTIDPHALKNPGGLGAGPQIKKRSEATLCAFEFRHATGRREGRSSSISDFKRQNFSCRLGFHEDCRFGHPEMEMPQVAAWGGTRVINPLSVGANQWQQVRRRA